MNQKVFGSRLKLARKMAGKSMQELADGLNNKITKQALSRYEQGDINPNAEILILLSKILSVKPDYFLRTQHVELGVVQFRKKANLSKKEGESIIEKARDYVERYTELENILGREAKFENPLHSFKFTRKRELEDAAFKLREYWNLGKGPILNIVEMLELKGIKVLLLDESDGFDGLAVYSTNNVPVVVVNVRNKPVERLRFTIMHELAHLLLDFSVMQLDEKEVEKYCHYFASCFLLPSEKLLEQMGEKRTYIAINELISIKEYYGLSIRAIVHRLLELEVISSVYYQKWSVYLSKTYGGKDEPGRFQGEERSSVFDALINRSLAEGLISISKAAALTNQSINDLRRGAESAK